MIEKSQLALREIRFTGHAISSGIGIGPIFEAVEPTLVVQHKKNHCIGYRRGVGKA